MTVRKNRATRALAASGVVALGLAGMFAATSAAHATEAAPGNIDTSVDDGSVIIHKHETTDPIADPGNPKTGALGSGFGDAIDGAGFTTWPIESLDLTNGDDWNDLEALIAQVNSSGACEVPGETLGASLGEVTTAGGIATVPNLTIGAYLVCETTLPAGASHGSAPFIVTVPSPYAGDWLYDVHVFPKNTLNVVEKKVEAPSGYGLGSTLKFPVSTTIKPLPDGEQYASFIISDTLDSKLGGPAVESVKINGVDVAFMTAGAAGNFIPVHIDVNDPGFVVGGKVEVVFSGTVIEVGEIENEADLFVNDPNMEGTGVPSNKVESHWGDLEINKVDGDSTSTGLAGAIFEVYESNEPYAADCSATTPGAGPIAVSGETTFKSGANGVVDVAGLYVTDSDNHPNQGATERCYFVKETQAPTGFITPTGDDAFTPVAVKAGVSASADVVIENTKQNVPELPLTGGAGQAGLIAGGLALVIGGITAASLRGRRKNAAV
ncbi:fimbrial isopeptide formation D2 family protein/LPXTG-motif cell wall-anchored protein [Leucobacter exalbidus]|uniref:Fimbrial isopeptide formation D2 family protein/LPXTG-motif cell wall-anchored protein n=1 Tax=Leucobacter exalbidus TaxID=662960 RepID=A0A940T2W3_9MICO|nr:SpaH/EbpB family LPXTG-anchored major pilin [Leucobacter exalbidus]MBP1325034.1 fimbrial isopeptide formation D2 family protein/LPXTG-motif cell wall-anchored protein [Leucobacter exalbidus]